MKRAILTATVASLIVVSSATAQASADQPGRWASVGKVSDGTSVFVDRETIVMKTGTLAGYIEVWLKVQREEETSYMLERRHINCPERSWGTVQRVRVDTAGRRVPQDVPAEELGYDAVVPESPEETILLGACQVAGHSPVDQVG